MSIIKYHGAMNTLPVQIDEGTGLPLVLLHDYRDSSEVWHNALGNIDKLSQRVVTIDLIGDEGTPDDGAEAVIATLDHLGIDKFRIAGRSVGCIVATDVAINYPERVEKLTLFTSGPLDFLATRSKTKRLADKSPDFLTVKNIMGRGDPTPRQGKVIGRILST